MINEPSTSLALCTGAATAAAAHPSCIVSFHYMLHMDMFMSHFTLPY